MVVIVVSSVLQGQIYEMGAREMQWKCLAMKGTWGGKRKRNNISIYLKLPIVNIS